MKSGPGKGVIQVLEMQFTTNQETPKQTSTSVMPTFESRYSFGLSYRPESTAFSSAHRYVLIWELSRDDAID